MRWFVLVGLVISIVFVAPPQRAAACWPPGSSCFALTVTGTGHGLQRGDLGPQQMAGVNRPGTEYACVQNNGFTDGTSDARHGAPRSM